MPFSIFAVGIDDRDLDAVHDADRVSAGLSVVEAIVDSLYGWAFENPRRILESFPCRRTLTRFFSGLQVNRIVMFNNVFTLGKETPRTRSIR